MAVNKQLLNKITPVLRDMQQLNEKTPTKQKGCIGGFSLECGTQRILTQYH